MLSVGLCLPAGLPAGLLVFLGFVSSFGSIDHRLQQFELLPCGAVQTVDFFDHIVGVGGCDPFSEFVPSTNKGLRISFLLGKDSEASVLQFFRNSGFHQQRHGTAQFILHAVNTQHLCRGSLSYSLVWSGFTGCIELLITSKMV